MTETTAPFWWQAFATGIVQEKAGADVLLRAVREGVAAVDETFMGAPSIVMLMDDTATQWAVVSDDSAKDHVQAMQKGVCLSALPPAELDRLVPFMRERIALEMLSHGANPLVNWPAVIKAIQRDPVEAPPEVSHRLRIPQGFHANPIACAFRHAHSMVLYEMLRRCPEAARALDTLAWGDGQPWLHHAATRDASLVQALVSAGANPNLVSQKGFTPLFCAHSPAVVEVLVAAGADPSVSSADGVSLLTWWRQNNTRDRAAALERALPAAARRASLEESLLTGRFSGSLTAALERVQGPRTARELAIAACALQAMDRDLHHRQTMPKKFMEQMAAARHLPLSAQESATAMAWTLNEAAGLLRADTSAFLSMLGSFLHVPGALEAAMPGMDWPQATAAMREDPSASDHARALSMRAAMLRDVMDASPDIRGLPEAMAWLCETAARLAPPRWNGEKWEMHWIAAGPLTILPLLANGAEVWQALATLRKDVPEALVSTAGHWFNAALFATSRKLDTSSFMPRFRAFFEGLDPDDTVAMLDAMTAAMTPTIAKDDTRMVAAKTMLAALLSQRPAWSHADWERFDTLRQARARQAPLAGLAEPERSKVADAVQASVQVLLADRTRHRLSEPAVATRPRFRA